MQVISNRRWLIDNGKRGDVAIGDIPDASEIKLSINPLTTPIASAMGAASSTEPVAPRRKYDSAIETTAVEVLPTGDPTSFEEGLPSDVSTGIKATLVLDRLINHEPAPETFPANPEGGYSANHQLVGTCSHCGHSVDLDSIKVHFVQATKGDGSHGLGCRAEFTSMASPQGWAWLREVQVEMRWYSMRLVDINDVTVRQVDA